MGLYKRGRTWWIDVTVSSGERIRRSAATNVRAEAQHFHDKLKAEAWRIGHLGEQPRFTWDDAGHKWLSETNKRTLHDDLLKLRWLQQFLRGKVLTDITRAQIAAIGAHKRAVASPATANRHLQLIRAILRKACYEWEWIDKVPQVKLYSEPKRRVRWITPDQARTLLTELPEHQSEMVLFALTTGLRQGNVTGLRWLQVDLERRTVLIPADQAKGGEDLYVPIDDLADEILKRQLGKHPERVFSYLGRPIKSANTRCWRSALRRAGISNFRWHDLRHTWASWHIQNGTPMYDLQEMGGWQSAQMVRRYAHLAPTQMASHAALVSNLLRAPLQTAVASAGSPPNCSGAIVGDNVTVT